jgi:antitoxin Phd
VYTLIEVIVMLVNSKAMVSISEANQNFSRVARLADEQGTVVIMKNNAPRYLLIEFSQAEAMQAASDEEVLAVSARLMQRNRDAYEVLAK